MNLAKEMSERFGYCAPVLVAISDPLRQQILTILLHSGKDGLNVNDITAELDLSRPAVSHHMLILKKAGLVKIRKVGTRNYYVLDPKKRLGELKELIAMLDTEVKKWNL